MIDWKIHHAPETVSTNLDAREGRHGDVFTADFQSAGRGRLDHKWLSPRGANVIMSAVLDVSGLAPDRICTLPLAVGLAVVEAIVGEYPWLENLAIKWPNDVFVGGRKVAGILCELNGTNVIAGIGVNVEKREFPPELRATAAALADFLPANPRIDESTHQRIDESTHPRIDELIRAILSRLAALYPEWRRHGLSSLAPKLSACDYLKGRLVAVRQTDDDREPVTGICGGIQADGTLLVGTTPVYAGEAHVERC